MAEAPERERSITDAGHDNGAAVKLDIITASEALSSDDPKDLLEKTWHYYLDDYCIDGTHRRAAHDVLTGCLTHHRSSRQTRLRLARIAGRVGVRHEKPRVVAAPALRRDKRPDLPSNRKPGERAIHQRPA